MPFAFPSCHCEEALAEADVAIQSESWWVLPVVPVERERGFFSTFLSLRALQGVAIHALRFFSLSLRGGSRRGRRDNPDGSSSVLPMLPLDCRVAYAPRNDKVWGG
jgi:hypothetical protein